MPFKSSARGSYGPQAQKALVAGWTSLTITTSSTGRDGPTSTSQVTATVAPLSSVVTYSLSAGKILLTVPASGNYNFTMAGAKGGNSDSGSQWGGQSPVGSVNGVSLSSGQVLEIVIGQVGQNGQQSTSSGGGGGATYVRVQGSGTPIGVSPGGGGGSQNQTGMSTTSWTPGLAGRQENSTSTSGGIGAYNQYVNGTHEGAGGGGWSSNASWQFGGISADGLGMALAGTARGGGGNSPGGDGGFGGGGRGGYSNGAAGGGGGYRGGWGGVYSDPGTDSGSRGQSGSGGWGFGLSYSGAFNNGAGYIIITKN